MASKERYTSRSQSETQTVPFENAEEAWFWFIQTQKALSEGARFTSGLSLYPRPCEPVDILKTLDRLYRQRVVLRDHLLVLRHYGRRLMPPDLERVKEMRAHRLWTEALAYLQAALEKKGIVRRAETFLPRQSWHEQAFVLEGGF